MISSTYNTTTAPSKSCNLQVKKEIQSPDHFVSVSPSIVSTVSNQLNVLLENIPGRIGNIARIHSVNLHVLGNQPSEMSSDEVKIVINLGSPKYGMEHFPTWYKCFATLHKRPFQASPQLTWVEAIREQCHGVQFNPSDYFIKRRRYLSQYLNRELSEPIERLVKQDYHHKTVAFYVCLVRKESVRLSQFQGTSNNPPASAMDTDEILMPQIVNTYSMTSPYHPAASERSKISNQLVPGENGEQEIVSKMTFLFKSITFIITKSHEASPELSIFHDMILEVDTSLTWAEIINQHFQVNLNPERYYVRRYGTWKPTKTQVKSEHDLREKISIIVQEFVRTRKLNAILLVDREGPPLPTYLRLDGSLQSKLVTKPKRRSAMSQKHEKVRLPKKLPRKRAKEAALVETAKQSRDIPMIRPISSSSTPSSSVPKVPLDAIYDEIRNEVYQAAEKLTNKQLLLARNEMKKLKNKSKRTENEDKWGEWSTTCPLPVAILRDLLDI